MADHLAHMLFVQVLHAYVTSGEQRPIGWLRGLADSKIEARRENGGRLDDERGTEQLNALAKAGTEGGVHFHKPTNLNKGQAFLDRTDGHSSVRFSKET